MPETYFDIKWPDGSISENYSPSSVVKEFFTPGESYQLAAFTARARDAMTRASDRVQQKYGFPCARARATLAVIEAAAGKFANTQDATVMILDLYE